jgi:hypothetical protein
MILSQSSAHSVASLSNGAETGTKRIVTAKRASHADVDPPRSQPAAKLLLLKEKSN